MVFIPRLLCYGHDQMLLYTREQILNREFFVERCGTLGGLAEVLSRGALDLVLLCHSVPDWECEAVIEKVREASAETKVLVLHESVPGGCSVHSDAAIESLDGPPALLHEIHALLGMAASQSEIAGESFRGKIVSFNNGSR